MEWYQLEEALTFTENKFGMDWLKDKVDEIKELDPERTTSGRYLNLWEAGVSPLALMWFKGREQLALYYLNGQFVPSPEALLLIRLINDIKTVENAAGLEARLEPLKDVSLFVMAAYEIHIAAGCAGLGQTVSFTRDLGLFRLLENDLTVAVSKCQEPENCYVFDTLREPVLIQPGREDGQRIYYVDYNMVPGEDPGEGLKHRAQLLRDKLSTGLITNVVCTTTVLGRDGRGYFLLEKSLPLWEVDMDSGIFLPDIERR